MVYYKEIYLLFFLLQVILLQTGCNAEDIEGPMKDVRSTNLSGEKIDGMEVGMNITDKTFQSKYGLVVADQNNDYYSAEGRLYDQYWIDKLLLGVDSETNEILSLTVLEDDYFSSSEKGIKLGDSIEDVIAAYGDNFYTYMDSEQSITLIGYVDHSNNLSLSFLHYGDKVTGISYRYAFDRLKWIK